MTDDVAKTIGLKFIGTNRPAETLSLMPGTTVADVLKSVGLDGSGYSITDPSNVDAVFRGADDMYARAEPDAMYAACASIDAGLEVA